MDTQQTSKRKGSTSVVNKAPGSKRRKQSSTASKKSENIPAEKTTSKGARPNAQPNSIPLSEFHESTLAELRPKYDVIVASVLSSTKIRNRVTRVVEHLGGNPKASEATENKAVPLALVHARPSEVCKMITIVEKVKAILAAGGKPVYQYNHFFEVPPKPEDRSVIEETAIGEKALQSVEEGEEESDDGFEKLEIYDRAANPIRTPRKTKSLAIFLSAVPIPELKSMAGITEQIRE